MKITVVAATGGIGRLVAEQAVAAGHDVTAVARRPERVGMGVRAVPVDLGDPDMDALASAVAGADAVVSGLGPRTRGEDGITSRGTAAVMRAMEAAGATRLVVVSVAGIAMQGSDPGKPDAGAGWFTRTVLGPIARAKLADHYADIAVLHDMLRASALDWTAVGFPLLTDGPAKGAYRVAYDQGVRGGWRISRADAAACMLDTIGRGDTVRRCISAAR
ncbi:MAG TPA: NAD(P)-binding oxidoreductase [Streptosporangiaceae bacterium]|jgi:putative NADH-flavin reductase